MFLLKWWAVKQLIILPFKIWSLGFRTNTPLISKGDQQSTPPPSPKGYQLLVQLQAFINVLVKQTYTTTRARTREEGRPMVLSHLSQTFWLAFYSILKCTDLAISGAFSVWCTQGYSIAVHGDMFTWTVCTATKWERNPIFPPNIAQWLGPLPGKVDVQSSTHPEV